MKIVDTHLHVWNLESMRLPWLEGMSPVWNRTYTEEDYRAVMEEEPEYQVAGAVYVEVDAAPEEKEKEFRFMTRQAEDASSLIKGGIIPGDLESEEFPLHLERRSHLSVKGVRHVLHVDSSLPGTCLKDTFVRNVRELGKRGLVFEACMRTGELGDLYRLAQQCPDTCIILNHMGNVDAQKIYLADSDEAAGSYREEWLEQLGKLALMKNVVCKISGLNPCGSWDADTLKPAVGYVLDIFGEDHIIYGGNFPVCNISMTVLQWVKILDRITRDRPDSLRRKLFHENAERIYKINCDRTMND